MSFYALHRTRRALHLVDIDATRIARAATSSKAVAALLTRLAKDPEAKLVVTEGLLRSTPEVAHAVGHGIQLYIVPEELAQDLRFLARTRGATHRAAAIIARLPMTPLVRYLRATNPNTDRDQLDLF